MGAIDESRDQLIAALYVWDWASCFPIGYTGVKAPIVVPASPPDIIDNFETYTRDQMTKAILSVESIDVTDSYRTLGDLYGPGANGLQRYGTRVELVFGIACWADQQAGGPDLVAKLAGQVQGCCFFNRVRLQSYRQLRTRSGHETYEDRPQLFRHDVVVQGFGVASYDA